MKLGLSQMEDQAAELCEELGDPLISVPVEVADFLKESWVCLELGDVAGL